MKLALVPGIALGLGLVACTTGDSGKPMMNPNGMLCNATFTVSGSFTANTATPAPAGYNGCWPAGEWKFVAAMMDNTCSTAPELAAQYQFRGEQELDANGDPIIDKFTLVLPDPATAKNIVKVSELGNGICEGEVEIFSADGTSVWNFRPDLQQAVGTTLTGQGEYGQFTTNQYPL